MMMGGGGLYIGFGMIAGVWRYHGLELFWIAFDVEWMDFGGVSSSFSVELREHKLGTLQAAGHAEVQRCLVSSESSVKK